MRTQQKSLTTEARPEGMIPMIAPTKTRKAMADRIRWRRTAVAELRESEKRGE